MLKQRRDELLLVVGVILLVLGTALHFIPSQIVIGGPAGLAMFFSRTIAYSTGDLTLIPKITPLILAFIQLSMLTLYLCVFVKRDIKIHEMVFIVITGLLFVLQGINQALGDNKFIKPFVSNIPGLDPLFIVIALMMITSVYFVFFAREKSSFGMRIGFGAMAFLFLIRIVTMLIAVDGNRLVLAYRNHQWLALALSPFIGLIIGIGVGILVYTQQSTAGTEVLIIVSNHKWNWNQKITTLAIDAFIVIISILPTVLEIVRWPDKLSDGLFKQFSGIPVILIVPLMIKFVFHFMDNKPNKKVIQTV